jgi:hypothetical protein
MIRDNVCRLWRNTVACLEDIQYFACNIVKPDSESVMQSNHDQRSKLDSGPSLLVPRLGSRVHEIHKLADFTVDLLITHSLI